MIRQRNELREYQRHGAQFIIDHPKCALWKEMGLGKTVSTLTALVDLFDHFDIHKVLVAAPLRVAKKTWPDEIGEWAHTRHLTFEVFDGTEKRLRRILASPPDITLISSDKVRWLDAQYKGKRTPFDTIVIDESSRYKTPSASRTRAMRRICAHAMRVIELTGTPAPNGLLDLWSQMYLLDRGERLGQTYTAYKERWFAQGFDGRWRPRKGAEKQIYDRVQDITCTMRTADYLQLPETISNFIKIELSADQKADYAEFERRHVLALAEAEITAANAAALMQKLLQYASGAVYDAERNTHEVHSLKVEALQDIVEDNPGKPILVAYNFISDAERILKKFPHATKLGKDMSVIDRWNRGEIPMLLVHPKSAGHGLNLQHGGHIMVWFSLTWALEDYQQTNKRLDRSGQKNNVVIHHLIVEGTMDEIVMSALQRKDKDQHDLLEAVKVRVKRLLAPRIALAA